MAVPARGKLRWQHQQQGFMIWAEQGDAHAHRSVVNRLQQLACVLHTQQCRQAPPQHTQITPGAAKLCELPHDCSMHALAALLLRHALEHKRTMMQCICSFLSNLSSPTCSTAAIKSQTVAVDRTRMATSTSPTVTRSCSSGTRPAATMPRSGSHLDAGYACARPAVSCLSEGWVHMRARKSAPVARADKHLL